MHRLVVDTPAVLVSIRDGYHAGLPQYERYIRMLSTHGGLNQVNSATFVMTMTGRLARAVPQREILRTIAPGYEPRLVR
jgi:hypothetical protein